MFRFVGACRLAAAGAREPQNGSQYPHTAQASADDLGSVIADTVLTQNHKSLSFYGKIL